MPALGSMFTAQNLTIADFNRMHTQQKRNTDLEFVRKTSSNESANDAIVNGVTNSGWLVTFGHPRLCKNIMHDEFAGTAQLDIVGRYGTSWIQDGHRIGRQWREKKFLSESEICFFQTSSCVAYRPTNTETSTTQKMTGLNVWMTRRLHALRASVVNKVHMTARTISQFFDIGPKAGTFRTSISYFSLPSGRLPSPLLNLGWKVHSQKLITKDSFKVSENYSQGGKYAKRTWFASPQPTKLRALANVFSMNDDSPSLYECKASQNSKAMSGEDRYPTIAQISVWKGLFLTRNRDGCSIDTAVQFQFFTQSVHKPHRILEKLGCFTVINF